MIKVQLNSFSGVSRAQASQARFAGNGDNALNALKAWQKELQALKPENVKRKRWVKPAQPNDGSEPTLILTLPGNKATYVVRRKVKPQDPTNRLSGKLEGVMITRAVAGQDEDVLFVHTHRGYTGRVLQEYATLKGPSTGNKEIKPTIKVAKAIHKSLEELGTDAEFVDEDAMRQGKALTAVL